MNVLVTNDDGFGAWGINALIKALSKSHNVFVVAPDGNRSGNSHHISLGQKLILTKISDTQWTSSGTPVDCVYSGLSKNMFGCKIDAVVSGINKGENLGTDVIFSGTCGAARQAVLAGVPGIAVSMMLKESNLSLWDNKSAWTFDVLADFVNSNLETLCSLCVHSDSGKGKDERCVFVNVNSFNFSQFSEVVFTETCFREFPANKITLIPLDDEQKEFESILESGEPKEKLRGYSDIEACRQGKIAVSRIYAEPCCATDINLDSIKFSL